MSGREMNEKSLVHDRLADRFDALMNEYDVSRRLEVLIDGFLQDLSLRGKLVLDTGCGTGRGSQRLSDGGATVVALDIGINLVRHTRERCACEPIEASVLNFPFANNTFDVVFSTEVIEHIPAPRDAVLEMYRVLKPGGHLALSTPNWIWQLPVRLASAMGWRPYKGFENFVRPSELRRTLEAAGGKVIEHRGLHVLPFQLTAIQPLLRTLDRYGQALLPVMVNQCIRCIKRRRI
jgi:2-polyprenyl-3-methyl-5-hydroxy-6-metoxy-1,4-benzoquinol methylase